MCYHSPLKISSNQSLQTCTASFLPLTWDLAFNQTQPRALPVYVPSHCPLPGLSHLLSDSALLHLCAVLQPRFTAVCPSLALHKYLCTCIPQPTALHQRLGVPAAQPILRHVCPCCFLPPECSHTASLQVKIYFSSKPACTSPPPGSLLSPLSIALLQFS